MAENYWDYIVTIDGTEHVFETVDRAYSFIQGVAGQYGIRRVMTTTVGKEIKRVANYIGNNLAEKSVILGNLEMLIRLAKSRHAGFSAVVYTLEVFPGKNYHVWPQTDDDSLFLALLESLSGKGDLFDIRRDEKDDQVVAFTIPKALYRRLNKSAKNDPEEKDRIVREVLTDYFDKQETNHVHTS